MNWLDIVILVAVAIAAIIGLKLGLIKAVLLLAGIIVGVVLAGHYSGPLGERLTFISSEGVAKVVAFAVIMLAVLAVAAIATALLTWAAKVVMLGWVNRLGGAVVGLLLGAFFCGALLAMWVYFLGMAEAIADSVIATILLDRLPVVLALLPGEFDGVRSFFH
ncbi:MAG: CvpA family protein [Deltaproteobacteria bacterium]|nr:CvpA family protein [Deltaproteobacteria bacterium]